jgi:hypothetical protein
MPIPRIEREARSNDVERIESPARFMRTVRPKSESYRYRHMGLAGSMPACTRSIRLGSTGAAKREGSRWPQLREARVDNDIVRLVALALAIGFGVVAGGMLVHRHPNMGYSWVGVMLAGAVLALIGLTMSDGQYLGGTSTPGFLLAVLGVVLFAAGLRLRRDSR